MLDKHGYVASGASRSILADLGPKTLNGTVISAEFVQTSAENPIQGTPLVNWVLAPDPHSLSKQLSTSEPFRFLPQSNGVSTLRATLYDGNGTLIDSASMDIELEDFPGCPQLGSENEFISDRAFLKGTKLPGNFQSKLMQIELVGNFKKYIYDSADTFSDPVVTSGFLATILFREILNRPKFPTASGLSGRWVELDDARKAISFEGMPQATLGNYENRGLTPPALLRANLFKSMGVGQIKMSTLAMSRGLIPIFEREPNSNRSEGEVIPTGITDADRALNQQSASILRSLWMEMRWPKSHIMAVCEYLVWAKNRPNRAPSITVSDISEIRRMQAIIATEYNSGITRSSAIDAEPSSNNIDLITKVLYTQNGIGYLFDRRLL